MSISRTIILFLIILNLKSFSQIEVGSWRDHFSYKNSTCVADAEDKIYVAGEIAIFSYDKEEGSIEKLSKINGLSDAVIQTIAYNKQNNTLVIAYENSNIDVLKNNTVYNFSEIKRKQISHNKTINKITFIENIAYLSCGFGIVLLDTDKLEFSDTFYIGENASYININDIATGGNTIYAATNDGIFFADINEQNLSDYRNWTLETNIPNPNYKVNILNYFNGHLFANQINPSTENDTLYKLSNNNWSIFNTEQDNLKSITNNNDNILFTSSTSSRLYNSSLNYVKHIGWYFFSQGDISTWTKMNFGILDVNSNIFIADKRYGLVHDIFGSLEYVYPNGPENNITAKAEISGSKLITTFGDDSPTWTNPMYNTFENEIWKAYSISGDTAKNFYSIAINPKNSDKLFIGSWGYGIFEFNNNIWENHFTNLNSSLQFIEGYDYGYIRISSLAFDNNNNLWIANESVSEPISVKTEQNEWESFNFNGNITKKQPKEILVTQNNHKWIILGENGGILAFDDNNTPLEKEDDNYKLFSPKENTGESISTTVNSIEEDKSGNIWVGTGDGLVIYYNPEDVFSDNFYADRIQLTSYGNDTTEQYLLSTDIVNDIETDGADRKWIATQNSGVFLVSDNGKEEIHNFNKYNSPLVSNSINDIAINHISGEVFFLTNKGIISYRSDATAATDKFGDVYVFPNPVRPNYSGVITITGLADEVNVKITDVSGNLVFETTALGGQAIWDGNTFSGRKVSTGVYLVYSTNNDGSETFITKFLFMN